MSKFTLDRLAATREGLYVFSSYPGALVLIIFCARRAFRLMAERADSGAKYFSETRPSLFSSPLQPHSERGADVGLDGSFGGSGDRRRSAVQRLVVEA